MLAQEIVARIPHGGMHDLFQRLQFALVSEHSGAKLLPIHAIGASCSRKPLFDGWQQCASWSLQSVYFRISIEHRSTLSAQHGGTCRFVHSDGARQPVNLHAASNASSS